MLASPARDALVVIGNFDGVHRGHQAVLRDGAREAQRRGLVPRLLSFVPHPAEVLGRRAPPTLTTLVRKRELVARVAPDLELLAHPFDRAFAAQSPSAFAEHVLRAALGARVVVVGRNFRFGKGRAGDFTELSRLGAELGFETRAHELVGDVSGPWSSTRAREALARGELDTVAAVLGRPHMVSGRVVQGDQRGRTIGFPTCNLAEIEEALPPFGVYAVAVDQVREDGAARRLALGIANLGVRPTVKDAGAAPSLEVHLFDWAGDVYGALLRVHFIGYVRVERRFDGLAALTHQIGEDVAVARAQLAGLEPEPSAEDAYF